MIRIATLHSPFDIDEVVRVQRGTQEYIDYKNAGWISNEQLGHQKYTRDYTPDYTEEPEDSTTEIDAQELLQDKVDEMFEKLYGDIDERYCDYKEYYRPRRIVEYTERKESTLLNVKDLFGSFDSDVELINYVEKIMPSVDNLLEIIQKDSDQNRTEDAMDKLIILLNGFGVISLEQSQLLGNRDEFFGTPLGTHTNSSSIKDRY